jgi:hypothetical protein
MNRMSLRNILCVGYGTVLQILGHGEKKMEVGLADECFYLQGSLES